MKRFFTFIMMSIMIQPIMATTDIDPSDPAKPAIEKALKGGYLSLYNNKFNGDNPLSRKEMAIAIDKILKKMNQKGYKLTQAEVQELVQLSKTFKKYLQKIETQSKKQAKNIKSQEILQSNIHHDLTKINDELQEEINELKKSNNEQHFYMMIAIGVVTILAL